MTRIIPGCLIQCFPFTLTKMMIIKKIQSHLHFSHTDTVPRSCQIKTIRSIQNDKNRFFWSLSRTPFHPPSCCSTPTVILPLFGDPGSSKSRITPPPLPPMQWWICSHRLGSVFSGTCTNSHRQFTKTSQKPRPSIFKDKYVPPLNSQKL